MTDRLALEREKLENELRDALDNFLVAMVKQNLAESAKEIARNKLNSIQENTTVAPNDEHKLELARARGEYDDATKAFTASQTLRGEAEKRAGKAIGAKVLSDLLSAGSTVATSGNTTPDESTKVAKLEKDSNIVSEQMAKTLDDIKITLSPILERLSAVSTVTASGNTTPDESTKSGKTSQRLYRFGTNDQNSC